MAEQAALSSIKRFFKLLQLDRKDIAYVYVYAAFEGLITLSLPLGIQAVIGLIAGGAVSASLILLVAAVTAATALSGLLRIMQITVMETVQRRIYTRSAFDIAYRIPRFRTELLSQHYAPELMNRFFDTLTLQKGIPKIITDISTSALQIFFGLLLISFYHPFFAFFGVGLLLFLFIIFRFTGPPGLASNLKVSKYKYETVYWLEELARSMTTFKLAGNTDFHLKKVDYIVSKYLDFRKSHFGILLFQYSAFIALKTVITAAFLLLGALLVIENQINIGQFVAAEIVVLLTIGSVDKMISSMETIYDVLTGIEKLGFVTDLPLETEEGLCFPDIDKGAGLSLRIQELSFTYPNNAKEALHNINLDISPGERVCISGYNGAGKSTLVQILSGLHSDYQGVVSYNGFPFKSLNMNSLREHIGDYCTHEGIFRGTILENITIGHEDVTLEDALWAAEKMRLDGYISQLPEGYNTMLNSEGTNVTQGVRTKIILARAIATRPALLAMESFLRNLDQVDRAAIAGFLTDRSTPWTLVTVSNDPVVAARCDKVVILKEGRIVQTGSFDEIATGEHFDQVFKVSDMDLLN
jgi:ABC-type bacteriocin/lantibiotic exporter with double-glycine peptidase domain